MSHSSNPSTVYNQLQQRFDAHLTGAPESPAFMQILKLLYSPEEAEIARQLPVIPTPLEKIANRIGTPRNQLELQLDRLAERGVVLDLSKDGQRLYALPPVVIGFFEYVFMRTRDDLPMAELASLFDQYMHEDSRFALSIFDGETQLARTVIREEVLPGETSSEVLDWERASEIIRRTPFINVTRCSCRHKASLIEKDCGRPQETCLTLGASASSLTKYGMARQISTGEALDILAMSKEHGLMQICDNVQQKPAFICNCCGCCCGMVQSIRRFDLTQAIMTSNWIMEVDEARCTGCGKCIKVCPVGAIELEIEEVEGKRHGFAVRDERMCLGCGVCASACTNNGISFTPRPQKVYTPETMLEHYLVMAVERGKLAELVLSQPENLSQRVLRSLVQVVEQSSPFQAAMAVKPLRSLFMNGILKTANVFLK